MLVDVVIDGVDVPEDGAEPVDHVGVLLLRVAGATRARSPDLYDMLSPRVFGLILRVLVDRAQSEEVLQEVFLEVWQSAGPLRSEQRAGEIVGPHDRTPTGRRPRAVGAGEHRPRCAHRAPATSTSPHDGVAEQVELRIEGTRVAGRCRALPGHPARGDHPRLLRGLQSERDRGPRRSAAGDDQDEDARRTVATAHRDGGDEHERARVRRTGGRLRARRAVARGPAGLRDRARRASGVGPRSWTRMPRPPPTSPTASPRSQPPAHVRAGAAGDDRRRRRRPSRNPPVEDSADRPARARARHRGDPDRLPAALDARTARARGIPRPARRARLRRRDDRGSAQRSRRRSSRSNEIESAPDAQTVTAEVEDGGTRDAALVGDGRQGRASSRRASPELAADQTYRALVRA